MRNILLFVTLFATLSLLGCGGDGRPEGMPPLYPLTVHVTQEGKPLEGATISLVPDGGATNWIVGGITDDSGNAKMMTYGKFNGAPEGTFHVTINMTVYEGLDAYNDAVRVGDPAAGRLEVNVYQYVEDAYMTPKTTPLKVEVARSTKVLEVDAGPAVKIKKPFLR